MKRVDAFLLACLSSLTLMGTSACSAEWLKGEGAASAAPGATPIASVVAPVAAAPEAFVDMAITSTRGTTMTLPVAGTIPGGTTALSSAAADRVVGQVKKLEDLIKADGYNLSNSVAGCVGTPDARVICASDQLAALEAAFGLVIKAKNDAVAAYNAALTEINTLRAQAGVGSTTGQAATTGGNTGSTGTGSSYYLSPSALQCVLPGAPGVQFDSTKNDYYVVYNGKWYYSQSGVRYWWAKDANGKIVILNVNTMCGACHDNGKYAHATCEGSVSPGQPGQPGAPGATGRDGRDGRNGRDGRDGNGNVIVPIVIIIPGSACNPICPTAPPGFAYCTVTPPRPSRTDTPTPHNDCVICEGRNYRTIAEARAAGCYGTISIGACPTETPVPPHRTATLPPTSIVPPPTPTPADLCEDFHLVPSGDPANPATFPIPASWGHGQTVALKGDVCVNSRCYQTGFGNVGTIVVNLRPGDVVTVPEGSSGANIVECRTEADLEKEMFEVDGNCGSPSGCDWVRICDARTGNCRWVPSEPWWSGIRLGDYKAGAAIKLPQDFVATGGTIVIDGRKFGDSLANTTEVAVCRKAACQVELPDGGSIDSLANTTIMTVVGQQRSTGCGGTGCAHIHVFEWNGALISEEWVPSPP